ncbi:MAG: hypothetical protein ABFD12_13000, partial [Syntrophorhabdus sp.]
MKRKKKKFYPKDRSIGIDRFRQRLFGGKQANQIRVFGEVHAFGDFQEMNAAAKYVASPTNFFHP